MGSFLADIEKIHFLTTKETVTWGLLEKIITCFNVLVSDFFDSIVTFNGIVRRDTSFSVHYSTVFWLLGAFFVSTSELILLFSIYGLVYLIHNV